MIAFFLASALAAVSGAVLVIESRSMVEEWRDRRRQTQERKRAF